MNSSHGVDGIGFLRWGGGGLGYFCEERGGVGWMDEGEGINCGYGGVRMGVHADGWVRMCMCMCVCGWVWIWMGEDVYGVRMCMGEGIKCGGGGGEERRRGGGRGRGSVDGG